jgi:hypothetical protein
MKSDLNAILVMEKIKTVNSFKSFSIENMLKALSQFMVMLTSSNSKFDHLAVPSLLTRQLEILFNTKCFLPCNRFDD